METILEETREKRKENTSVTVRSTKKYEICMQQEISNRKYIHFETLIATHESLPTAIAQHHLQTTELGDCTCHYRERKREIEEKEESMKSTQ